jgi:shikimate kinase
VAHALDKHVALIGFMGAGKSTLGVEIAQRLGRRLVDLDRELERSVRQTIPELFAQRGEAEFRVLEAEATLSALENERPAVLALGGGAVETPRIRRALREQALTVWVDVDPATAWGRVEGKGRPLARDEESFQALYQRRRPLYAECADVGASEAEEVVLAAAGIVVEEGALTRLAELLPEGEVEVLADATVPARRRRASARSSGSGATCGSTGTARSSPSAAAARPTRPGSPLRPICAASAGWQCLRRSWARSTRRSVARPRSTSRRRRTSSERFTGPSGR